MNILLKQARVDVNFLESAAKQITDSNNNLRTSLTENEKTIELEEESEKLKGDLQKSRDRARFKLREERSLLRVSLKVFELVRVCQYALEFDIGV